MSIDTADRSGPRGSGPSPGGGVRPADEIDLVEYARTCWHYRYVLIAIVLITAVAAYAINRRITPTYEATFRLMASEPRLGNDPEPAAGVVAFRELVESPNLVAGLIEEFRLHAPPHNLTPQRFLQGHLEVEVIRDSTIIRVAVRLTDRDLLVRVARRYAELVVSTAQRLNTEGIDYTTRRIKEQRDESLIRLGAAEQVLQAYREEAQVELLERDVDTMLARRPEALDLAVQIQAERARVQQVERELARHEPVRGVRRSLDSLPAVSVADAGTSTQRPAEKPPVKPAEKPAVKPADPDSPAPQDRRARPSPEAPERVLPERLDPEDLAIRGELLDPYVNPVYEALARDAANARTRLAALQRQRDELVKRLQLDAPAAQSLKRLYVAEARLATLERDQTVAREAYLNAANKYEDARLQSTVRTPRLHILDAALPPDRPVAPRTVRNTAAATLIALTLGAIGVIVWNRSRQSAHAPA